MPTVAGVTDVTVIKLNGSDAFATGLQSVSVRRSLNNVGHAHIRVRTDDPDAAKAKVEAAIAISIKEGSTETSLFEGEIVGLGVELRSMGAELVIDAYDKAHRLMRQAPIATHLKQKPSDVISKLAQAVGMSASVDAFGSQYDVYHQWGSSGRVIDDLCRSFGAEWWVEGNQLTVRQRTANPPASGVTLTAGETLRSFSARFTAGDQVEKVGVRGWDIKTKQAITGTATGSATGISGGPSLATMTAGRKPAQIWSRFVNDATAANAVASAAVSASASSIVTGRGECEGNGKLVPGKTVTIAGMGDTWNGAYYVTAVEHLLEVDRSLVTRFTVGGADEGSLVNLLGDVAQPSTSQLVNGLTIGIVTNSKDEELKLNRVKVKFPYLSDADESQWARVVTPGGGNGRGFVHLPEVDDEVLVGFENGDLNKPVVLGGLWNGKDAPPLNATSPDLFKSGKVSSRSWVSRNKHKITMVDDSDDGQAIKLELADTNSSVTLVQGGQKDGVTITAKDKQITITTNKATVELASSGDITLKGQNVKIEASQDVSIAGLNVKIDAKTNLDLGGKAAVNVKGGGKVGVEASGITEIKGSLVKVN